MAERWQNFSKNKWLVLGAAICIQACDGVGYAFGSYSPAIKSVLGFSQKQISALGVAKDIGDSVGLLAGYLSGLIPIWGLFVVGATMSLLGYGWMWLIVTGQLPVVPFWTMCIIICMATNGETFLNTGVLVSCVRNFPQNRGGIVGILKGFTGLSGAIFTQLYASFYAPDKASFIFLVAVGPFMVTMFAMFIVRPIPHSPSDPDEDNANFSFIYSVCLAIAAYLMGTMVLDDFIDISSTVQLCFAFGLLFLLAIPLTLPFYRVTVASCKPGHDDEEAFPEEFITPLLPEPKVVERIEDKSTSPPPGDLIDFSEMEDEKMPQDVSDSVRRARLLRMSDNLFKAVAEGAVKVKRRRGPHRGEDFTLMQALVKADFWLLFFVLVCGAGTGLTAIDNLGQVGEAEGFASAHIFVSLISIWSFLGRIGSGWASEIAAREYAVPRPALLAVAQGLMAFGNFMFAMSWPMSMYVGSLLVGFGYGCHWSVIPATASELFGLKNFGALYNVLTMALPVGSLVFSGLIAGPLYDRAATKQKESSLGAAAVAERLLGSVMTNEENDDETLVCRGAVCFQTTFLIMTLTCLVGVVLNLVLVKRTKRVYQMLYGKRPGSTGRQPGLGPVLDEENVKASNSAGQTSRPG